MRFWLSKNSGKFASRLQDNTCSILFARGVSLLTKRFSGLGVEGFGFRVSDTSSDICVCRM